MSLKDIPEIEAEFPGWISLVGGQMHARLKGAFPVVMVHAETLDELGEQVRRYAERGGLDRGDTTGQRSRAR
jgi:hypothetical protein